MMEKQWVEMPIPKPYSEVILSIVLTSFVLFFVSLAILNLVDRIAVIPSILWLLYVSLIIQFRCKENGIYGFFINFLGKFSLRQFVERNQTTEIRFGYQLAGYRLLYFKIPVNKIESVEWKPGQASERAGRDMNDWYVSLWFDHDDPIKSQKKLGLRKPDQDVYVVSSARRREDTEFFGMAFLNFLQESGVFLSPVGEDKTTFSREK